MNKQDFDCLVKWRTNSELIKYFRNPMPITRKSHINWYEKLYMNNLTRYNFIVIDKKSGQKIGVVGVSSIDYKNATCEIFYMIAECEFKRKGFASEAISTMVNKMYMEGILTIYAEIHKENIASIKMIQKLGFNKTSERGIFCIFSFCMKNKQEVWVAMIISGYSKKLGITISEAAQQSLFYDCLNYLEEYYETLHLLSNEDVICELMALVAEAKK
jgi:RimJ/RimL family protein N-acetyltransferase